MLLMSLFEIFKDFKLENILAFTAASASSNMVDNSQSLTSNVFKYSVGRNTLVDNFSIGLLARFNCKCKVLA